jgi:hypothetical protein
VVLGSEALDHGVISALTGGRPVRPGEACFFLAK